MIKVKSVHPEAKLPTRANNNDAGADLYSVEHKVVEPLTRALISTGITIELPENVYGRIAPRSGLAFKHGLDILAGVIDEGYRGTVGVIVYNTDKEKSYEINIGDKIAQLIIETYHKESFDWSNNLSDSERSEKGFGSSGTK
jgi:dUTP pyrophosphatase